mmetsp:Transcript_80554/g.260985  ORF Transcript_80554/g.260985 Transcript_80554/m.260985 type:complete len:108 (+) Transcript_80554:38-361(+)
MDDIKAAVGSGDFQRCYELLRDSTASAADLGPCIDFALGLADSTAVHLLLAFGASLDIRQAKRHRGSSILHWLPTRAVSNLHRRQLSWSSRGIAHGPPPRRPSPSQR